jgi:hypothetical protein
MYQEIGNQGEQDYQNSIERNWQDRDKAWYHPSTETKEIKGDK